MSPRGYPDYMNNAGLVTVRNLDTNDIYAALVKYNRIDSRGRILFVNNFQDGISSLYCNAGGDGIAPVHAYDYSLTDYGCLRLNAGTVGGSGNSYAYRYYFLNNAERIGMEFAVRLSTDTPDFTIRHYLTENGVLYRSAIRILYNSHKIEINTPSGFVEVYDFHNYTGQGIYYYFKLVSDISTGYYKRLLFGRETIDISDYEISQIADTAEGFGYISPILTATAGSIYHSTQIGYFLCTTDEP